jgi:1,4-dihydroxy-2-naphthoate octaprenyltransferase
MTRKQAWIHALRLRTLPLSLSGIILGSGIAASQDYWNWLVFLLAMVTTVLFQILSNLANDLGDSLKGTDNAQRIGPVRSVQSGVISTTEMKKAVIFTALLSFISAGLLIYFGTKELSNSVLLTYIFLAIACVIAAITYTVGKKAYGYHGLGDLMVLLFFGGVSVLGVYPLFAKHFDWLLILPAFTIGSFSTAVLNLNNMRDRVNDERSGKRTLVVLMGPNLAKLYHTLLILSGIACIPVYLTQIKNQWAFIGLAPCIVLLLHVRKVMATKNPADFDPELKKVALSTFAFAVLTALLLQL